MRPNLLARPACIISVFVLRLVACCFQCGPCGAPPVHHCAAGEGCLRRVAKTRKPFFHETTNFLLKSVLFSKNKGLRHDCFNLRGSAAIILRPQPQIIPQIWGFTSVYPQVSADSPAARSVYSGDSPDIPSRFHEYYPNPAKYPRGYLQITLIFDRKVWPRCLMALYFFGMTGGSMRQIRSAAAATLYTVMPTATGSPPETPWA